MVAETSRDQALAGSGEPPGRAVVEEVGDLRRKNQVTIPKAIAKAMGLRPGDRLVFRLDSKDNQSVRLYRLPKSFAGIAPDAYGGPGGAERYLEEEREGWAD